LSSTRGGGFGPAPINYRDIQAWAQLTGNRPTPAEVKAILHLDAKYLQYLANKDKDPPPAAET
jgi:hypothetical protein